MSKGMRVLIAVMVSVLGLPGAAVAGTIDVQAESMTWPTGSGTKYGPGLSSTDPANPSESGYALWANYTGTATVATDKPLSGLSVRLRSDQSGTLCQGSPQVVVKIDGVTRLTSSVTPSTTYASPIIDVGTPLGSFSVPAGTHTVAVQLTNDHDSGLFPCDRNLWIDKVGLVSSQIFADTSWRNQPLAADAPLDADQSLRDALQTQVRTFGTYVNYQNSWNVPVYTVPAGQPLVDMDLDDPTFFDTKTGAYFAADLKGVPVPPDATGSGPKDGYDDRDLRADPGVTWADREAAIYQPATDTLWEFIHFVKRGGVFRALEGGRITGVSTRGTYDSWPSDATRLPGVAATRIPLLATLQRVSELQAGAIRHPVTIHVPHATAGPFRAPALATDGDWSGLDAVPEGTRFRLPASLDIDALPGLTPYARIFAKAVQSYGLIVTDKDCWTSRLAPGKTCPAVTTVAEAYQSSDGTNPYPTLFAGQPVEQQLANFPWDLLQVLPPTS